MREFRINRITHFGAPKRMTRFGDIATVGVLLAITLPLMIFVGVAIRFESAGPVLEYQAGIGDGGRRFKRLKFRTAAQGPQLRAAPWAQTPTRVGIFLQQTRIEHLPQLINVLRGEMRLADSFLFD